MAQKDFSIAVVDFLKLLTNTLIVVMFGIAAFNLQTKGSIFPEAMLGIEIIVFVTIVVFIIYLIYLLDLKKLKSETVSVKLDVNLNDDIILTKDEKFKIIFDKDDKGNLVIRKG